MDARVNAAKRRLLAATEGCEWRSAVGVGRIGEAVGLVLSVRQGARSQAEELLARLDLGVAVGVREVGDICARAPVTSTR